MEASIRYQIDTAPERMQFDRVHAWLTKTYWSPGIPLDKVVRAAQNSSLVIGAFDGDVQVGYLRVVSDRTTFAWICDVYVAELHRGRGLAKLMVNSALEDGNHQGLRRWLLATLDAHAVYRQCGFEPIYATDRWMVKGANPPA